MTVEHDFLKARTQIVGRIQGLEKELEYWRDELGAFDRVEATLRRLGSSPDLNGKDKSENKAEISKNSAEILDKYAASKPKKRGELKKLVLDAVLKANGVLISAKEVERTILQSGYVPAGKHFDISVYQTLCRLAFDQKLIGHQREGSKLRFLAKASE